MSSSQKATHLQQQRPRHKQPETSNAFWPLLLSVTQDATAPATHCNKKGKIKMQKEKTKVQEIAVRLYENAKYGTTYSKGLRHSAVFLTPLPIYASQTPNICWTFTSWKTGRTQRVPMRTWRCWKLSAKQPTPTRSPVGSCATTATSKPSSASSATAH